MNAIFNTQTKKFKTPTGWTDYVEDKKGQVIQGLENVALYTDAERRLNPLPHPLEWRHVNARVNWRMIV